MEDLDPTWLALYNKARRFADNAHKNREMRFLLFAFSVEFLFRACLARKHPLILFGGDASQFRKSVVEFCTGIRGKQGFSIGELEVGLRWKGIFATHWDHDVADAFEVYKNARNEDVHTGSNPWTSLPSVKLNEYFYLLAERGTKALGTSLEDFLGEHTTAANALLDARTQRIDEQYKKLTGEAKSRFVTLSKSAEDLAERRASATIGTRNITGRNKVAIAKVCPVCGSDALLFVDPVMASPPTITDGQLVQSVSAHPQRFACSVCGLRLDGNILLQHASLGDTETLSWYPDIREHFDIEEYVDPVELLSPSDQEDLRDGRSLRQHREDEEYQRWRDERGRD
jgi:hypothetical protein